MIYRMDTVPLGAAACPTVTLFTADESSFPQLPPSPWYQTDKGGILLKAAAIAILAAARINLTDTKLVRAFFRRWRRLGFSLRNIEIDSGCLPGNTFSLIGHTFHNLHVLSYAEYDKRVRYSCRCDCGKEVIVSHWGLLNGNNKSCGCVKKRNMSAYLGQSGAANVSSKLTQDIVDEIRMSTEKPRILAARYGVSRPTISKIKGGQRWKEKTDNEQNRTESCAGFIPAGDTGNQ